jgi:hypothetical protein
MQNFINAVTFYQLFTLLYNPKQSNCFKT